MQKQAIGTLKGCGAECAVKCRARGIKYSARKRAIDCNDALRACVITKAPLFAYFFWQDRKSRSAKQGQFQICRRVSLQRETLNMQRDFPLPACSGLVSTFHVGEILSCRFSTTLAPQAYFFCCSRKSMQKEELGREILRADARDWGAKRRMRAANLILSL